MRHYVVHYDMCDTIKLECGEQFCPDHDENQPAYVTHVEDTFTSLLHTRGECPECDSCWADVDANAAYDAELVTCPDCHGDGEHHTHQNYWGQWDTKQCLTCKGECEIPRSALALVSS